MNKKILLSLPDYSSYYLPIKNALEDLGYKTYFFDYRHGDKFAKVLGIILGQNLAQKYKEFRIKKILSENDIKIFLTIKGETLSSKFLESIENDIKTVNWFPDPMNHWEFIKKNAKHYQFFLHFDPMVVRKLRNEGNRNVYYLPFAADIGRFKKGRKKYDVTFVGTYSKYREDYLSGLKHFNLNIWGDSRWFNSELNEFTRGGRISQDVMKKIIDQSKININLIYNAPKEGVNLRVFEVTGIGGFLLTEHAKDLENLFKLDKEVVSFKNKKELQKKVEFYLDNKKLREKIAERGYLKSKLKHNYKKRVKQFLEIVN